MLEANKNRLFDKVFSVYNRNLLKRRFNSLQLLDSNELARRSEDLPLIVYANHSGWFDGLIAYQISNEFNLDSYLMMEEKQLKDLFLFRKLGAFSVVRNNPREAVKSINYAAKILKEGNGRVLWIFPQGEILPNDVRPLFFYRGISKIIEKVGKCNTLSMAIRYEFSGNFKPDIFVGFGKLESFDGIETFPGNKCSDEFARQTEHLLDNLKSKIVSKNISDFENIL